MRSKHDNLAWLRGRYARALGLSGAALTNVIACASAEKEYVVVPMSPPPVDAGSDAQENEGSAPVDAGPHATRPLREPPNNNRCTRVVRCRPEDEEAQALPYPDPFSHCSSTFTKSEHDAQFSPRATTEARANSEGVCCYVEFKDCRSVPPSVVRGRPLRIAGKIQPFLTHDLPQFSEKNVAPEKIPHAREDRARLAMRWTRDAALEHASIASFERLAISLARLGADASLVRAARRAAREELRHANDAFALASAYAGHDVVPAETPCALDVDLPDLATLARETFLDGCIGETAAALTGARELAQCEDGGVARVLTRVVRDETRHAELAFRILGWCIARGGDDVKRAINFATDSVDRISIENLEANDDRDLVAHGEISAREHADAWNRAAFDIALPLVRALPRSPAATCTRCISDRV